MTNEKSMGTTSLLTKCMILLTAGLLTFFALIAMGIVPFFTSTLMIRLQDNEKVYDGTPLCVTEYELVSGNLPEGANLFIEPTDSLTYVGTTHVSANVYVLSAEGKDITSHYNIKVLPATLTVTRREITVRAESLTKTYDGKRTDCKGFTLVSGELATGDILSVADDYCCEANVGKYRNAPQFGVERTDGTNVTGCYRIRVLEGWVTIEPIRIHVRTEGANKAYDGTPLVCPLWEADALPEGLTLLVDVYGSQTDPGACPNWCDARVLNPEMEDVTWWNVEVWTEFGDLIVYEPEGGNGPGEHSGSDIGPGDGDGSGGSGSGGEGSGEGGSGGVDYIYVLSDHSGNIRLRAECLTEYDGHRIKKVKKPNAPFDGTNHSLTYTGLSMMKDGFESAVAQITAGADQLLVPYAVCGGLEEYCGRDDEFVPLDDAYLMFYVLWDDMTFIPDWLSIPESLKDEEIEYAEYARKHYLQISEETRTALREYVSSFYGIYPESPWLANDLLQFVRNTCCVNSRYNLVGDYSYTVPDMAVHCLTEEHRGNRLHVTSATVMLYRAFDIPARLVHGYEGKTVAGEWSKVSYGNDSYWVEIYLPGIGWIAVDPIVEEYEWPGDGELTPDLWVYTDERRVLHLRQGVFNYYDGHEFIGIEPETDFSGTTGLSPLSLAAEKLKMLMSPEYEQYRVGIRSDIPLVSEYPLNLREDPAIGEWNASKDYFGDYIEYDVMTDDPSIGYNWEIRDEEAYTRWKETEVFYRDVVYSFYTDVPYETRVALEKLGAEAGITSKGKSEVELIRAITKFVQSSAVYDMDMAIYPSLDFAPYSNDSVVEFLTVRKYGVCRHFAAAATLMLRTYGIPARYTVGFLAESEGQGWTEIDTSKQGHAWVEAYIDGFGWVTLDPTAGVPSGGNGGGGGSGDEGGGSGDEGGGSGDEGGGSGDEGGGSGEGTGGGGGEGTGGGGDIGQPTLIPKPKVSLKSGSASKVYDGKPFEQTEAWMELLESYDGTVTMEPVKNKMPPTDVGVYQNTVTCKVIYSQDGETGSMLVDATGGTLTVEPRPLTIRTGSAEKEYDGSPLYDFSYEITEGSLVPGDWIAPSFWTPYFVAGTQENTCDFRIYDENGRDVTGNYCLTPEYGILQIH